MRCTDEEEAYLRELPDDLVAAGWRLIMAARPQRESGPGYMAIYRRPANLYAVEALDDTIEKVRSGSIWQMRLDTFRQDYADPKYRSDIDAAQYDEMLPLWLKELGWAFRFVAWYKPTQPDFGTQYCIGLGRFVDGALDLLPGYSGFTPEKSATMARDALIDYYEHRELY